MQVPSNFTENYRTDFGLSQKNYRQVWGLQGGNTVSWRNWMWKRFSHRFFLPGNPAAEFIFFVQCSWSHNHNWWNRNQIKTKQRLYLQPQCIELQAIRKRHCLMWKLERGVPSLVSKTFPLLLLKFISSKAYPSLLFHFPLKLNSTSPSLWSPLSILHLIPSLSSSTF